MKCLRDVTSKEEVVEIQLEIEDKIQTTTLTVETVLEAVTLAVE